MIYIEDKQDLFNVSDEYYLAHCISGDYALGAGIAKVFNEKYNMRFLLHKNYPIPDGEKYANVGKALLIDNVFNLVTKSRYYHKPTYSVLNNTLQDMKNQAVLIGIKKIAMPLIGCGLDRLEWEDVKSIIINTFSDTDIEILICRL